MRNQKDIVILIPAYHPDERLPRYIRELKEAGLERILVVDDGSGEPYGALFKDAEKEGAVILSHEVNRGKGEALKTGFRQVLSDYPECAGVVTADSDGQHTPKDIIRVAGELTEHPEALILGVRDFSGTDIPPKSLFGNRLTVKVFKALHGKYISDTQTGLRGIRKELLPQMLSLRGSRFEYEMGMLVFAAHEKIEIREIPIETIYTEENKGTHFRPIVDSVKIYGFLLASFFRYLFSSLSASLIDLLCFTLFNLILFSNLPLRENVLLSTVFSRIISSLYNFFMNRRVVFRAEKGHAGKQMLKYYILAAVQMLLSAGLVYCFTRILNWNATVVKVMVDTVLFFISFQVQNRLIFKN